MFLDAVVGVELAVLARLIPPKGRLKSGKSHWKFSTEESVQSLIVYCQVRYWNGL